MDTIVKKKDQYKITRHYFKPSAPSMKHVKPDVRKALKIGVKHASEKGLKRTGSIVGHLLSYGVDVVGDYTKGFGTKKSKK